MTAETAPASPKQVALDRLAAHEPVGGRGCTCPVAGCKVHDEWFWRDRRIVDTPDECDTTPLSDEERLRVRVIQAARAIPIKRWAPPPVPDVDWSHTNLVGGVARFRTVEIAGAWVWAYVDYTPGERDFYTNGGCTHDDPWVVIWRYPDGTIDCATCGDRLALRGEWDAAPEIRTIVRVL